ncbi:MAG TPA: sugar transferase [Acidimicrobiales bacterium]|nr:sugar transferase [Acidimicrobiales bacterium]
MPDGLQRLAAAVALLLLAPLLVVLAVAVAVTMGRPVIYRAPRAGRHGEVFDLLKFRSMTPPAYADQPDAERLTRFGRWLRSTSLDELPELVNIVRGDMVLVGPRPLFDFYTPHYDDVARRRLEVKPGLTGWAQVNGRNATAWADRFALDAWYVEHRSVWLDIKILARTVVAVLRREGVSHDGHDTMPVWVPRDAAPGVADVDR